MHSVVTIQLLQSFVVFHLHRARKFVVFVQLFRHVGLHDNKAASATDKHAAIVWLNYCQRRLFIKVNKCTYDTHIHIVCYYAFMCRQTCAILREFIHQIQNLQKYVVVYIRIFHYV
jgi:hypothetical protein